MSENDKVRQSVSRAYAKAITRPAEGGCCGGAGPVTQGAAATLAGYTTKDLQLMPAEAAVTTFGCGNPTAFSAIGEGDVVLDLGSGAGMDLLLAAKKVGPRGRVIGVDMTDEMITRAEENIRAAGLDNVEVRRGIIEELPVEDASVDWVISNCVINLSPEKEKVFAEIARVLKPGGRMLVSDIVVKELPDWVRDNVDLYNSCVAGAISEDEYLQGLRDAGMEEVEVRDRLVYDAGQLGTLAGPEISAIKAGTTSCCGSAPAAGEIKLAPASAGVSAIKTGCCAPSDELISAMLEQVAGNVWSAQIFARKAKVQAS